MSNSSVTTSDEWDHLHSFLRLKITGGFLFVKLEQRGGHEIIIQK